MSLRMIQAPVDAALVGASYSVSQLTTDVTEWDTLFAPDDDIHGALMAELQHATSWIGTIPEIHSSQYGFTDEDVAAAFIVLGGNPKSRFLFDKTQAAGVKESPIIAELHGHLAKVQLAVGTSSKAHQILHTKAVAILYPDGTGWTLTGSFNLSASAEEQFNIVDIVRSRSRAELFAARIDAMFEWVETHEPQS